MYINKSSRDNNRRDSHRFFIETLLLENNDVEMYLVCCYPYYFCSCTLGDNYLQVHFSAILV